MSLQELVTTLPPLALYALFVYIGSTIRAGKGERTTPRQVAVTALAPAFVVFCVLMLLQYALESVGIRPPVLPIACLGGLLGFVANWVCEGVERNGKRIAKAGALEFFADQLLKIKPPRT